MNKAFVKEEDDREPRCPGPDGCGGPGVPVPRDTVAAQAPDADLSGEVLFCEDPDCAVGYFDPWGGTVPALDLSCLSWPKDPGAPVCPCFGLMPEDVIEDAGRGDPARLRDLIARSEGPDAACETRTPEGTCCVPRVRRLYMRHLAPDPES